MSCQTQREPFRDTMHDIAGSLMVAPSWANTMFDRRDISGTSNAYFGDIRRKVVILACVRDIRGRLRRSECMSDTTLPSDIMQLISNFL